MKKIDELINGTPKGSLFHYTNACGLLGILRDGKIWATSAYHLNDSEEYRYAFRLIAQRLRARLKSENDQFNDRYGRLLVDLESAPMTMQAYVASFSEEGDLLSQWLSYPRSPNGYSIGLSADHFVSARECGFTLMPCVYDPLKQEKLADAVIEVLVEAIHAVPSEDTDVLFSKALTAAAALKHPGFEREAEWRLVRTEYVGFGASKDVKFRQGRNGIVPFAEAPLVTTAGRFIPTAIHVGPNEDMEAAKLALKTLLDSQGWHGLLGPQIDIEYSRTPYRP